VITQGSRPHRFGPDFVEAHRKRYGKRPPEARQLTYDIAVEDEYAPWRQWLDDQLALLPDQASEALARRVWLDEHFWPVNFELATGAGLRAAGLCAVYEQAWDGLSPDWTVLSDSGRPLTFVEVHTDMPAPDTFGRMRAWHGLVERIKAIPVPVLLQLASTKPVSPLDARTAKKIAQDLRRELLSGRLANTFWSQGYTFLVMRDPRREVVSALGMHACFDPPSSRAGSVTAQRLMEGIEEKVRKYKGLAAQYEVPLIVAVGAHRFTGVTLDHLDDVLTGLPAPKITFQFNAGDPYIGTQAVDLAPIPPWEWPSDLAGLLWIENQLPFDFTARPNPSAQRQMPLALTRSSLNSPTATFRFCNWIGIGFPPFAFVVARRVPEFVRRHGVSC
jgi:hypothetical protein